MRGRFLPEDAEFGYDEFRHKWTQDFIFSYVKIKGFSHLPTANPSPIFSLLSFGIVPVVMVTSMGRICLEPI